MHECDANSRNGTQDSRVYDYRRAANPYPLHQWFSAIRGLFGKANQARKEVAG
jgi:hypothetical protein